MRFVAPQPVRSAMPGIRSHSRLKPSATPPSALAAFPPAAKRHRHLLRLPLAALPPAAKCHPLIVSSQPLQSAIRQLRQPQTRAAPSCGHHCAARLQHLQQLGPANGKNGALPPTQLSLDGRAGRRARPSPLRPPPCHRASRRAAAPAGQQRGSAEGSANAAAAAAVGGSPFIWHGHAQCAAAGVGARRRRGRDYQRPAAGTATAGAGRGGSVGRQVRLCARTQHRARGCSAHPFPDKPSL
eukprot:352375-Chlamydomonas_euryale.AAC.3